MSADHAAPRRQLSPKLCMSLGHRQSKRHHGNCMHDGCYDLFPNLAALTGIGEMSAGKKLRYGDRSYHYLLVWEGVEQRPYRAT